MQGVIAALVLLTAGADPVDKEKLRRSIEFPSISLEFLISMNSEGHIVVPDRNVWLSAEIAAAEKSLRGDAENADRYRALWDLYSQAGEKDKAKAARMKAANLYRAQRIARPHDGLLLAHFADCQECRDQRGRDEVEKMLRQAVELAPAEWECWVLLAGVLEQKSYVMNSEECVDDSNLIAAFERQAREGKITPAAIRQCQDCLAQALVCLDRAVAVAPREPKVYLTRAGFWLTSRMLLELIRASASTDVARAACFSASVTDICPDLWRAAALKPDDSDVLGVAAYHELMAAFIANKEKGLEKGLEVWKANAAAQGAMAQLEKLAADPEPLVAARAAEMLSMIYLFMGDFGSVDKWLSRALRLNPDLDQAWDLLSVALSELEKPEELLSLSRERLKHKDSARNRFLLAKECHATKRTDEAVQVLEVALQREPDDLHCNLALAALLMKRSDGDPRRVGQLLKSAEQALLKQPNETNAMSYGVLFLTYLALNGFEEQALEQLRQLSPERRSDSGMQNLLKILEPALPTAPSQETVSTAKGIDATAVAAYENLGAVYGGWVKTEQGSLFQPGRSSAETGLPGFRFRSFPSSKLPEVAVPFSLDLSNSNVTDAGLKQLAGLKNLAALTLWNTQVTDAGLAELAGHQSLAALDLGCTRVTSTGLKELAGLKNLASLGLRQTQVTDAGLTGLAELQNLVWLDLRFTQVTNAGLTNLAGLKSLATLFLDGTRVTDEGVKELASLKNLSFQFVEGAQLTNVSLRALLESGQIHTLAQAIGKDGSRPKSDDEVMALYLHATQVTDVGLKELAGLKNLTFLMLDGAQVTEAGRTHLVALKNLTSISLSGTRLTDAALAELRIALPNCVIRGQ